MSEEKYFAARPMEEVGQYLLEKVTSFYDFVYNTGRLHLWHKSYKRYHNSKYKGGSVNQAGEYGEYLMTSVNDYRNILRHILVKTTSTKPAFEPTAANTDYRSQSQTILARGILDYEMKEKGLDSLLTQAVESAIYLTEGFIEVVWDATAGEVGAYDENDEPVKLGDIQYSVYTPNNVIRDPTKENYEDSDWLILRRFQNKFNVAAKYGKDDEEMYSNIMSLGYGEEKYQTRFGYYQGYSEQYYSEDIPVYTLYHRPTDALPEGRLVMFLDDETILIDNPLPYDEVPVYRITPDSEDGTPFGYSTAYDLIAIQEMLDILYSIVLTNQKTFGVQSILAPENSNVNAEAIAEGLSLITYKPFGQGEQALKPEPLQFTHTPPEVFNFINQLKKDMETISGVNSVTRGDPQASLQSGAALALIEAQAIQFNSGLEREFNHAIESVGTAIVNILKMYANEKRMITIAGKSKRSLMKEFSSDDLSEVNRVTVQAGNPLTKTPSGKMELANILLGQGFIQTPEQLLQVLQTGQLDPLIEGKTQELLQIKQENEDLMEGRATNVQAIATDTHALHIMEHRNVLAAPDAREDPELVQRTLEHIQEHLNILMNPQLANFLLSLGQQPMQQMQPQQPGQGGQPAGELAGQMAPPPDQLGPAAQEADVNLPNAPTMPLNPLTNKKYDPVTGGYTEGAL